MAIYYKQIVIHQVYDLVLHNSYVDGFWDGSFFIYYPGYQILVGALRKITGLSVEWSSIIILSLSNIASVIITAVLIRELCMEDEKSYSNKAMPISVLIMATVVNIAQPIFTSSIRPGWSSGNSFISPTQAVCKPFALLSFWLFFKMYKKWNFAIQRQILFFVVLALSCLMKPLFAMAFIPAMGVVLLVDEIGYIKRKERNLGVSILDYLKKIWPLFVAGLILIVEFVSTSYIPENMEHHVQGGIGFGFWSAWRLVVPNIPLSILMAYAFPTVLVIALFIAKPREVYGENIAIFTKLTIPYAIFAFLFISFLFQKGSMGSVDFRTAWCLLFTVVYTISSSLLFSWKNVLNKETKELGCFRISFTSLLVHFFFGAALIAKYILL